MCRKIESSTAEREAYTLENNLERCGATSGRSSPISSSAATGMNGFFPFGLRRVPEPNEPGASGLEAQRSSGARVLTSSAPRMIGAIGIQLKRPRSRSRRCPTPS